jgi:hypothetical protein
MRIARAFQARKSSRRFPPPVSVDAVDLTVGLTEEGTILEDKSNE